MNCFAEMSCPVIRGDRHNSVTEPQPPLLLIAVCPSPASEGSEEDNSDTDATGRETTSNKNAFVTEAAVKYTRKHG